MCPTLWSFLSVLLITPERIRAHRDPIVRSSILRREFIMMIRQYRGPNFAMVDKPRDQNDAAPWQACPSINGGSKSFASNIRGGGGGCSPSPTFLHAGCSLATSIFRADAAHGRACLTLDQHRSPERSRLTAAAPNRHCGAPGLATEGNRLRDRRPSTGLAGSSIVNLTACS
jgi:hypothetical protein